MFENVFMSKHDRLSMKRRLDSGFKFKFLNNLQEEN
jgi:hypothetical protein